MKVAIYTRVSTADQTVQPQLIELRKIIQDRKWNIAYEFTDTVSGAKAEREGLDALMAMVRTKQIDVVCAVKIDRLARSIGHMFKIVEELLKHKVALLIPQQGIDTSSFSACGELQLYIIAAFAQFERSLIVERTKAGLVAARARGKVLGRPSPKMAGVDRAAMVRKWMKETGGENYAKLGEMLGGVSAATAWRVVKAMPPAMEVVDE